VVNRQAGESGVTLASSLSRLSMDGKIAVVTGSTQGLGEAIAHLFAERGCKGIVITGRNERNGARVKADLEKKGTKALFVKADLASMEEARKIIAAADREFGRVDALINAAGITDRGTIWDTSPELFDRMVAVNLRAPYFLIQDALHVMKREKTKGSIVNIISISGHGGQDFISAYCVTKGALIPLTRNTAFSVMRHQIRVNGLMIGWMDSPGEDSTMKTYHGASDGWLAKAEAARPFGRLLKTDEVARACGFLASEESGMMTGAIIDFDQQVIGTGNAIPEPPAV
jgi:NAD(P)-dependent dehydrogenase (short-subunit alcohol dehydrogenase family)